MLAIPTNKEEITMNFFLAAALSFNLLIASDNEQIIPDTTTNVEEHQKSNRMVHDKSKYLQNLYQQFDLERYQAINHLDALNAGDFVLMGLSMDDIQILGLYLGNDQYVPLDAFDFAYDCSIGSLSKQESVSSGLYTFQIGYRPNLEDDKVLDVEIGMDVEAAAISEFKESEKLGVAVVQSEVKEKTIRGQASTQTPESFLGKKFDSYFINDQQMPFVITPKEPISSLSSFQKWAKIHSKELKTLIAAHGAVLLRDFPIEQAEEFAGVVKNVLGSELMDYLV